VRMRDGGARRAWPRDVLHRLPLQRPAGVGHRRRLPAKHMRTRSIGRGMSSYALGWLRSTLKIGDYDHKSVQKPIFNYPFALLKCCRSKVHSCDLRNYVWINATCSLRGAQKLLR
jgi:hypothetical protein